MTEKAKLPDQAAIDRAVARLSETCRQLDALTLLLDDVTAQVEAENRRSPCIYSPTGEGKAFVRFSQARKIRAITPLSIAP